MTLLSAVIFLPLLAFLIVMALPKENHNAIRMFSLIASIAIFIISLGLIGPVFSATPGKFAIETNQSWIQTPAIDYHIGLDGISLWLVMLSTLLTPLCVLVSWKSIDKHIKQFFAFLLLLEFGLVGVFCALDLFLFFVFWEVSLVPMYFLIGIWGHDRRIYSAVKFFLYTMAGSALMLIAMLYLYNQAGTFDYTRILAGSQSGAIGLSSSEQLYLFLGFFIAFAIKVPLFPLHTWLPDAHVEAPTAGSVMLASVMLKMGTYGLLRFCVPLFPNAARQSAGWIAILAIIGIVYGALVAMVQPNMKKLVAYSSVSHLGFVVLGIFSFTQQSFDGAVYQMLAHGISTGALFLIVGFLYERRHSLDISAYGGVATPAPWLSTAFMITMLASIGLPMLCNFIGEYLVLQGTSLAYFRWTVFAALGSILAACYMLWLYQRAFFGQASEDLTHHMPDLNAREYAIIVPLILLMLWMGTYTQSFLPPISASNAVLLGPIDARREIHVRAAPAHIGPPQISPPRTLAGLNQELNNAR
jgi:NADH-quinone oxidoreductase subunit M